METVVFIAPHLDDVCFSCGALVNTLRVGCKVVVVTVCAGLPEANVMPAPLDVSAGFSSAREAVEARRREDIEACGLLGADTLHLDVLDYQYERHLRVEDDPQEMSRYDRLRQQQITDALAPVVATASTIIAPVGIRHPDHKAVASASRAHAKWMYEELPYRVEWPEQMPGLPHPVLSVPCSSAKLIAMRRYWSQLQGQPGWQLKVAEHYHAGVKHP